MRERETVRAYQCREHHVCAIERVYEIRREGALLSLHVHREIVLFHKTDGLHECFHVFLVASLLLVGLYHGQA